MFKTEFITTGLMKPTKLTKVSLHNTLNVSMARLSVPTLLITVDSCYIAANGVEYF